MLKTKYILPCLLLAAGTLAAQTKALDGAFSALAGPGVEMQAGPQSEESARTAGRLGNEVDDYLGVNDWEGVAENMPRFFLFGHLGKLSSAGVSGLGDVSLGAAFRLKSGYLALYYEGFQNSASGWSNKESGAVSYSESSTADTDKLALLFGSGSIGAIRLDVLFDGFSASAKDGPGDQSYSSNNNRFGATVQWGKNFKLPFGTLKPNASFGFLLPGVSKKTDGGTYTITGTTGNYPQGYTYDPVTGTFTVAPALGNDGLLYASLAPELALENWTFSLGYSFYYDLGYQEKFPGQDAENSRDGQFWHKVALGTSRTWEIAEKFSFAVKPVLNLGFYSWDGVCKSGEESVNYGAFSGFELSPEIKLGVKYQVKETVSLYAGSTISPLSWKVSEKAKGSLSGMGSAWSVNTASGPDINLGVTWTPVPALSIEFGFDNLIDFAGKFGSGSNSLSGGILVRYKPQASASGGEASAE